MGIRIRLPGVVVVAVGIAGILFLVLYRQEWSWVEMGVLALVVGVGLARSLKGA